MRRNGFGRMVLQLTYATCKNLPAESKENYKTLRIVRVWLRFKPDSSWKLTTKQLGLVVFIVLKIRKYGQKWKPSNTDWRYWKWITISYRQICTPSCLPSKLNLPYFPNIHKFYSREKQNNYLVEGTKFMYGSHAEPPWSSARTTERESSD
jgi:hypothetical protein